MIRRLLQCRHVAYRMRPFPECCNIPDHELRPYRCIRRLLHRGRHDHADGNCYATLLY